MPDSKHYLALCAGGGWLAGIWLGSLVDLAASTWLLVATVAVASAVLLWRVGRVGLILAAIGALCLGAARHTTTLPAAGGPPLLAHHDSGPVVVYGRVLREPELRDTSLGLRVAVTEVVADGLATPLEETILVRAPRFPRIEYGSEVRLVGELQRAGANSSDGYAAYLARQNIHSEMSYPQVTVLATGGGSALVRGLLAVKDRAREAITRAIPEPQASLLVGILLGDDSGMPRELDDAFRRTGMTHIIAISGFNIALLIALADRLTLPFMPRRAAAVAVMVMIGLYAALVGGAASVVRATVMGAVYLLSMRFLGRPTLALASLIVTAVIMTAIQPQTLWDIGFQLSFAATLGLMLYAGPWTRWLEQRGARVLAPDTNRQVSRLLGEAVVVTAAAQVLALPLILYHFGQLSLVSMPANLLVLPAQPAVMVTGGLTALSGMAAPVLGQIAGWFAWLFLAYTEGVVELLAAVPHATVPLPLDSAGLIAIYLAIIAATVAVRQREGVRSNIQAVAQSSRRPILVTLSVLAALLAGLWATSMPDGRLHVAFLDVGQGDATLIETPGGRQVLIDGGQYPTVILDELGRRLPFWDRTLDVVVATHPDDDHIAGLVSVLERYQVDLLVTNGADPANDPAYSALLQAASSRGSLLHVATEGETLHLDEGVTLTILHPSPGYEGEGTNDLSVVGRLAFGNLSVLLTGDAEHAAEQAIVARGLPVMSTVLKAGHHGSNGSSGEAFLQAVRPQIAIISAGKDNRFGHPHPDVLARLEAVGATVLRTDQSGTLELISDGRKMWWQGRE